MVPLNALASSAMLVWQLAATESLLRPEQKKTDRPAEAGIGGGWPGGLGVGFDINHTV